MASSASQSAESAVSDDHQETKRMKEVRNRTHANQHSMARRHWTQMEDIKVLKHVVVHGGRNWEILSDQLHGRSPDSCKVRWFNKLNPILKKRYGKDEEKYIVRKGDHARKHTKLSSSAGTTAIRLPTDVQSDSTVVPLEKPSVNGIGSNLSCKTEISSKINPVGKSVFNVPWPSDGSKQKIFMAKCPRCKGKIGTGVPLAMNLINPINFATNNNRKHVANVSQPPPPPPPSPSTPKLIDFLGVGSV